MTEQQKRAIEQSDQYGSFVDKTAKLMERAMKMTENYDYLIDYMDDFSSSSSSHRGNQLNNDEYGALVKPFVTFNASGASSISAMDWNEKFPELLVSSYHHHHQRQNNNSSVASAAASSSGDEGLVHVWNMHVPDRAEFSFVCQSEVLSCMFNPFQPQLIVGGTFSGQLVVWDCRLASRYPCQKTPLSVGHSHPIYGLDIVGSANAHSIVSISTDGLACSWQIDRLVGQPTSMLELTFPTHMRTDEVAVTSLAFPNNIYGESDLFFVGTEEGKIYQGSRVDRAGSKAGLFPYDTYKGHSAPVTSIKFHPVSRTASFTTSTGDSEPFLDHQTMSSGVSIYSGPSKLFLSSGMDWSVRVWKAKSLNKPSIVPTVIEPLVTLGDGCSANNSIISDANWHPIRPNIIGSVNGAGQFEVWDLNADHQVI